MSVTLRVLLATAAGAPDTGPDQLAEFWPIVVRAAWFSAGFLVVVVLGWYVVAPLLSRVIRRRNRNNPTIREAILRYFRLPVVVLAVAVGAGFSGYRGLLNSSALVVAAATLAVGVAGETVIGSLISGLVLVFDPEFNVGNHVEWESGQGIIEAITLRVTRLRTPDGELVMVPNTLLTGQPITRPYGRRYRAVEHLGLAYRDDIEEAMALLEAAAAGVEGVVAEPAPTAYVENLADDAVVVRVNYWLERPSEGERLEVRSRFARAAEERLEDAGITISPASQREVGGWLRIDDGPDQSDGEDDRVR